MLRRGSLRNPLATCLLWWLGVVATATEETREPTYFTCGCVIQNHVLKGAVKLYGQFPSPKTLRASAWVHDGENQERHRQPILVEGTATATEALYILLPTELSSPEGNRPQNYSDELDVPLVSRRLRGDTKNLFRTVLRGLRHHPIPPPDMRLLSTSRIK
ncbi:membrane glycoprotein US10 [Human betaherpesvirus 5]|nr:membrane glycoprotein US10 [Human betaherpesvirus 5]